MYKEKEVEVTKTYKEKILYCDECDKEFENAEFVYVVIKKSYDKSYGGRLFEMKGDDDFVRYYHEGCLTL